MGRSLVVGMGSFSACLLFSATAVASDSECDAVADNIVANCGFETGAFSPEWTLSGDPDPYDNHVSPFPYYTHSGNFGMAMGSPYYRGPGCISQTLTTVPDQRYDLSYWLEWNYTAVFFVLWNAVQIDRPPPFDYQPFTRHVIPGLIGTGADTLTFCAVNDDNFFGLDDIVVIPSQS